MKAELLKRWSRLSARLSSSQALTGKLVVTGIALGAAFWEFTSAARTVWNAPIPGHHTVYAVWRGEQVVFTTRPAEGDVKIGQFSVTSHNEEEAVRRAVGQFGSAFMGLQRS